MKYRIKMKVDYMTLNFLHPGPGSEAVKFMEELRETYFQYIGNDREATFDLSVYEEDEDARDQ